MDLSKIKRLDQETEFRNGGLLFISMVKQPSSHTEMALRRYTGAYQDHVGESHSSGHDDHGWGRSETTGWGQRNGIDALNGSR